MAGKPKPRILTHKEANDEDFLFSLKLTPLERLQELHRLRILNYGDLATAPLSRKIELISIDD